MTLGRNCCNITMIQQVLCHEPGCPEAYKDETRRCKWCEEAFTPEHRRQVCCSHLCEVAYENLNCDCSECLVAVLVED